MQTATQSYGTSVYTQIQGSSSSNKSLNGKPFVQASTQQDTPSGNTDSVSLSVAGIQLSQKDDGRASPAAEKGTDQKPLNQDELKLLTQLKSRDAEVRAHEQAHLSAAGGYAKGGATFSYTTGPNGKSYASGGKVPIDLSNEASPDATIQKMRTVRRAALAPADPSSADRAVASKASAKELQAMKELQELETLDAAQPSMSSSYPKKPESSTKNEPPDTVSVVSANKHTIMASAYQAIANLGS